MDVLEPYNVLYHGMDNTGQTNCSAIMLTLITASASTGRSIYFPRGTYLFTSSVTIINNTRGLTIYGEGKETVIIGDLSSNSSMWWFQDASGITVGNIYFDWDRRNGSLLARALSFSNPSDCQTNKCWFYDMQSPVFMYVDNSNLPDTNQIYRYNHIRDCFFDSNGNDGNGYLMVSLSYSSITGCTAINLRNDGGVNFALQLKNECYQCILSDCIVDTAYRAVVFGNGQINALGCQQCVVSNISIQNCFQGITLFATVNCIVKNCVIDMEGINQSQMAAISFLFNSINHPCRDNSVTGITIKNFLITTEAIIRLNQYSNDNLVVVDMLDDSTASLLLATFGFNTAKNKVIFREKTGGFATATISNSEL